MNRQLVIALAVFAIMAGGVAWIAFVLVKSVPVLTRVYGVATAMKRRTDLLKQADTGQVSQKDLEVLRRLTVEMQRQVQGEDAMRLVERELEAITLAERAVATGDWQEVRACLGKVRRTWL